MFTIKLKNHKLKILISVIIISGIFVLGNINNWWKIPFINSGNRTELPQVNLPSGQLTLITEPDQGVAPLISLIKNASHSIDLVMYEFTDKNIGDALVEAQTRGVNVRVLMNKKFFNQKESINTNAYTYLKSKGVAVNWSPIYFALTHQKTLIVDENKALIMTFNLVPKYYVTGRDFGILDINQNDVRAIEDTFNADWNNNKQNNINGDDLVWSPGSENDMLLIIKSAKKTLQVYNEEMADQKITDALIEASKRGVNVQIVMTYASNWRASFAQLRNNGVHIHTYEGTKALYIHAKMIISDGSYAFLGSENFSEPSLEKNRELGIFISDPQIITSLSHTFTNDWQGGVEF